MAAFQKRLGILLAPISTETKQLASCSISEIPEGNDLLY